MKRHLFTLAVAIFFLLISTISKAQTGTLTIEATHFKSNKGVAIVPLFREQDAVDFSNEWNQSLFSGVPNFRKLTFRFDEVDLKYPIVIR
jgi:hypothetical protein